MGAADALSGLLLPVAPSNDKVSHIVEQHIDYILSSTHINDMSMTQIKEATALNPILVNIMIHCHSQWPDSMPAAPNYALSGILVINLRIR